MTSTSQNSQPAVTLTLESTGIFLGVLVSASILVGIAIKVVSRFNEITSEIRDLKESLNSHAAMIQEVKTLQKDIHSLDKRFDIHSQDYVNHKDANLVAINGVTEQIKHKWQRTEEVFERLENEIKNTRKSI
ncbi:hypothetical protein [Nostoc sp.]|uniref:hypothetical protein n=1 Tax=Nostoc sp. TaxID=1180 RepID=UPI002FF5C7CD